jgi:hypothetical protein
MDGRIVLLAERHGITTMPRLEHGVAAPFQNPPGEPTDRLFILDDQHGLGPAR